MGSLWRDLRYAIRMLGRMPGLTLVAVLTLALGIGANTAIFSVLDQILLRKLPVKDPGALVLLNQEGISIGNEVGSYAMSYPMYCDLRDHNQAFTGLLARAQFSASLGYQGEAQWTFGELVSGNYFRVLGVKAAVGRTITEQDDLKPGAHPVAVLSYDLWVNRFAQDPNIVGRTILVNNHKLTVIGVSEKGFDGVEMGMPAKFRVPMAMARQMNPAFPFINLDNRRCRWVQAFGRLKPGVTREQARASLQPLYQSIVDSEATGPDFARFPENLRRKYSESRIQTLAGGQGVPTFRQAWNAPLWIVMAMVGLLLLIACVNLANLLVARASARKAELAIRMAIGAGRFRIVRQLFSESVVLAVLGAAAGLFVTPMLAEALVQSIPLAIVDEPLKLSYNLDWRVLAFTSAASVLAVLLFGLLPAVSSAGVAPVSAIRRQATGDTGRARLRMALISAQVGFSLLMLIAASLFVRSLVNLRTLDPGFDTRNVVTFAISPELNGYSGERTMDLFRRLRQGLERIPGADAAGLGMVRPLEEDEWDSGVRVEGYQPRRGENMLVYFNATSPGYFRTLEIPILDGRDFEDADGPKTARVAIVNGAFARHYFGDRPAVGRYIAMGGPASAKPDIRIIGVVRDSKYGSLRADISPQVFLPYTQMPFMFGMNGYLRTSLPPEQAAAAIRRVLGEIDPALPVIGMRTLDAQRSRAIAKERLLAWLAMAFGAAAALLTALGLYGVLAYAVSRRTRELGVRIALGAGRSSVIWLVVREALLLWGIGAAVALPTALALGRFLRAELFGVAPGDPWMMAAATLLLALIAALATALPARRAVRIDPVQALQYE